jgi:hypothetical protein
MTAQHNKALVFIAVGIVALLATKPLATALVGIPPLLWNAIYPIGVIVGLGCLAIGIRRFVQIYRAD